MYNNPYLNNINMNERIDNEIEKLKQMKANMQQPTPITQNFQLAPSSSIKYANTLEEVQKEMVYTDTPYFSKDMSVMWLKLAKGEVKIYELNEIIPKDEKDLKIELLQAQLEELKGMIKNESNTNDTKSNKDEKSSNVSKSSKSNEK